MTDLHQWCAQFGILSTNTVGGRTWRLTDATADERGVRLRFVSGLFEVVVRLDPRVDDSRAYALSETIAVSHGPLPTAARDQTLKFVAHICSGVVAADSGQLGGEVSRLRRGFKADDATHVGNVLSALPGADCTRARRFIEAIVTAVGDRSVPAWVVEPSFRVGERSFRVSVNATLAPDGHSNSLNSEQQAVQSWRRLCVAAGLPAVVPEADVRAWVRERDQHVYVGVAFSDEVERSKLYFHASQRAFLSFLSLLPVLGFNSSMLKEPHMICADFDLRLGRFIALKSYQHEVDESIACTRHDNSGAVLDRSVHRRVAMDAREVADWFAQRGDAEQGRVVGQLVGDGLLCARVASDSAEPTLYTAISRDMWKTVEQGR